jgi:tRNA dimethylallyltransferase
MDIGTAKLSPNEQEGIPHHLIDAVEPTEEVTAVLYRELFDEAVSAIGKSGKTPIVAGGSTLYLAAALDEMQFAPTDPEVRAALEAKASRNRSVGNACFARGKRSNCRGKDSG